MTDDLTVLATRFQAGDRAAFGALYLRLREVVFAAAARIVRSPSDADDLVQTSFVRAWNARARLRDPSAIRAWLLRIVVNQAHTLCARRRRFVDVAVDDVHADDAPDAEATVARRQTRKVVEAAIQTLSPRQCGVVTLRVREDLSFKQIGARLGCTDVAARVNYLYGVRNLQARLAA